MMPGTYLHDKHAGPQGSALADRRLVETGGKERNQVGITIHNHSDDGQRLPGKQL